MPDHRSSKENQTKQNSKLRLALDIGTNSIGWALYNLNKGNKPIGIKGSGVRIFSSGRNTDHTTLNASRREARLQRRQRDRYLQRRSYLLHLLKKHKLFPEEKREAKKLESINPYELRGKGLDEKIDIHHFGRALFHINQNRGFKSNRKSSGDDEGSSGGIISQSIDASKEKWSKTDARTHGEFLWHRLQQMEEERRKPGSQKHNWIKARRPIYAGSKDCYAIYANRKMIENEFNQLWDSQSKYHPILKDQKLKEIFSECIFDQRPLKKPIVGKCHLSGADRVIKSLPSFEKFRALKEFNNLSYINNEGRKSDAIATIDRGLEFRHHVIEKLFKKKRKFSFDSLKKEFKKFFPELENTFLRFNLNAKRDKLQGFNTSCIMREIIKDWDEWPLEVQDEFIEKLEGEDDKDRSEYLNDEEVLDNLKGFNEEKKLNLQEDVLNQCLEKLSSLASGHANYSKKVILDLIPFLEKGKSEYQAIQSARYGNKDKSLGEKKNKLPRYQEILKDHCVESRPSLRNTSLSTLRIPNPTVHIAFNQIRLVVNDIIQTYGKPHQVVIETARDLPMGQKTKNDHNKKQRENEDRNNKSREFIEEFKQKSNRDNRIRHQLWEEQNKCCIYSGNKIPKTKLFSSETEVDHILPFSKTLDDGYMNKVLVYATTNRDKGNKTPYEYFFGSSEWKDILNRSKDLPKPKQWRFDQDALEKFKEEGNFLDRQLNDTRYISKYAKQYLETICKDVWTVRGQTTFIIRPFLQVGGKNRDDHRHHALDAVAVGLVDRSFVKHISDVSKRREGDNREKLRNIKEGIKESIIPWKTFKEDVKKSLDSIVVSHRKRTKKEGQLHKEFAYGFSKDIKDFSKSIEIFKYDSLDKLNKYSQKSIEKKIVSEKIKKDFLDEIKRSKKLSKEFLTNYHNKTGIRRVKIKAKETIIPIRDSKNRAYKGFNGESNYSLQLFQNKKGKWDAKVISTFEANQKDFKPASKDSRIMKGDMFYFDNKFWRLVKFSQKKEMCFIEHFEANVSARVQNKELKYQHKNPSPLQKLNPKRVHISPCGKVKLSELIPEKEENIKGE